MSKTNTVTPIRRMANEIARSHFGYPLDEWVADQRDEGESWQTIAASLHDQTDGVVDVSWETLRRWFKDAA